MNRSRAIIANGFTLIELLAAMVAGSLLLALLSWSVAGLARDLLADRQDRPMRMLYASAPTLTGLIGNALPVGADKGGFMVDRDRLVALVPPPQALGPAGPLRMTLSVRRDREGASLLVKFEPTLDWISLPEPATREQLLVSGFADIAFTSLPRDERSAVPTPRLVKIAFTDDDGVVWPIAIEPRVTLEGGCRFDPISLTCRS